MMFNFNLNALCGDDGNTGRILPAGAVKKTDLVAWLQAQHLVDMIGIGSADGGARFANVGFIDVKAVHGFHYVFHILAKAKTLITSKT